MKKAALNLILLLFTHTIVFGQTSKATTFDLAIKNVDIFDSKTKNVLENKTILIRGDTFASIVDSSQTVKATKTIKGNGRLVIPGFIDTHTHLLQTYGSRDFERNYKPEDRVLESYKKLIARQYLANGITTIFDMGQPESWVETSVKLQNNPTPEFPNLFINGSSTISDPGPNGFLPLHHEPVSSAEDGRKKVQKYAKLGIKHMKLYSRLKAEDMKPIVEEAKKYGITLNAHVDNNVVTISQAMDLGVRNFEHFFTVIPSILNYRRNIQLLDKKYGARPNAGIDGFAADLVFYFGVIKDDPDLDAKLNSLFERMAKENVTISTALNVLATGAERSHTFSTFEFLPPRDKPMTKHSETQKEQVSKAFDSMMNYMKVAHDKGVKIRIGTDTRYGGKAFLSELMLFSEAGFPVGDVLQIATINGADAMKVDDRFGSIEEGKKADLVIFDKSPFDDYKNFNSQKTIIKGGKLFELKKSVAFSLLDKIENDGAESASKWFRKHKNSNKYGSLDEAEMNEVGFQLLSKGKTLQALAVYNLNKEAFPTSGEVYNGVSEDTINGLAYDYLGKKRMELALELFKFNVEHHPKSSNAFDSLGEFYLANDNKELGLANYKKAVELNPDSFNAINVINKIEGKKVFVSDTILDSYRGEYKMQPDRVFIIVKEEENLFWTRIGRTYKIGLEPISDERFVFPGTNESVLFEKDSSGKVIGLSLDQNGRITKLKKIAENKNESSSTQISEEDAVRIPLNNYLMGHKTRTAEYMRKAFHTEGKLIFIRDGKYTTWDFQDYIGRFGSGNIAADEDQRTRTIESIDIAGNAAIAKLVLDYPTTRYVDYASLLKFNGEWKIVSKVFYAEPKIKTAGINKLKNKSDSQKFDKAITEFMKKHSIPGISLAFTNKGEILYASGYGFADKAKKEKININHRLRIASVAKPITSAVILMLIEQNKLSLDDKLFGKDGIFKGKYLQKPNANIETIEVRHLLQHTAAPEWSNQGNTPDPMFVNFNLTRDELIRRTLEERIVSEKPGTSYAYSNFGYSILGRVIEQVSGKKYSEFTKETFSQFGINSFEIAGEGSAAKYHNEVTYYEGNPPLPYDFPDAFPTARMDSHGGWVATAVDILKFAQLVDGFEKPKGLLSPQTVKLMKTTSTVSKTYGLGWEVDSNGNSSHSGSLPGTSSTLVNTNDGMTWCILANARGDNSQFYEELEGLMWKITKEIEL